MLDSKGETNQWKNLSTAFSGIQLVCRTVFIFLIHYGRGKKKNHKDTSFDLCGTFFLDGKYFFFPWL